MGQCLGPRDKSYNINRTSSRSSRSRVTFHFCNGLIFFLSPPPTGFSPFPRSSLVSRFVLLSSRVSHFLQSTYGFTGQWCAESNKVSIIPPHLSPSRAAPLRDAARRVVPRWVPPREYEERRQPGDTLPQFSHCSSSACTYEINLRVGGRGREKGTKGVRSGWPLWPRDRPRNWDCFSWEGR